MVLLDLNGLIILIVNLFRFFMVVDNYALFVCIYVYILIVYFFLRETWCFDKVKVKRFLVNIVSNVGFRYWNKSKFFGKLNVRVCF